MRLVKITSILLIVLTAAWCQPVLGNEGSGTVSIGYTFLDEEGNQAGYYRSYNEYDGVGLSLEKFRYRFDNGWRFNADLKNITLNNRSVALGLNKPAAFGVTLSNHQYERVYSFEGGSSTRRRQTGGSFWYQPNRYVRLFGGVNVTSRSGESVELFQITPTANFGDQARIRHDYDQTYYHGGLRVAQNGNALELTFRANSYSDNITSSRNQDRFGFRATGIATVPSIDYLVVHGGLKTYQTKYANGSGKITSTTGWGGATYLHSSGLSARYSLILNRAGAETDPVKTDHLAHAFYVSYAKDRRVGATIGYQRDLQDDLTDEISANNYYVSAWYKPGQLWDIRGEYGLRAEEVTEGFRLVGDQDRTRHRVSVKFRPNRVGWIRAKHEQRHRENDQLGTEVDFSRITLDGSLQLPGYGALSAGYAHALGEYTNVTDAEDFEFTDDILYGDLALEEWNNLTPSFGATYYRSKRDLDIESFSLDFSLGYRFLNIHELELTYRVHNFDDFLIRDGWYTANIVEVKLNNDIAF